MTFPANDITHRPHESCGGAISRGEWIALGVILTAAAILRICGIGAEALWTDESATLRAIRGGWFDVLSQYNDYENTPPLYYLLLHAFAQVFGTASDAMLRVPSVVFGLAAVVFTWVLTRQIQSRSVSPKLSPQLQSREFNSNLAPSFAAAVVALSWPQIYFSQEARAYAMFAALAALSSVTLVRAIDRPTAWRYLAYILAAAAMNYTHFAAAGVLIAHCCYGVTALWKGSRRTRLAWIGSQAVIAMVSLPLVPIALKTRGRMLGIDSREFASVVERFAATFTWLAGNGWLFLPLGLLILWALVRSRVTPASKVLVVGLMVFPPIVPLLGWYTGGAQYFARHALPSGLAMAVGAAIGLTALPRRVRWPLASVLVALAAMVYWTNRHELRKPAMREAAAFVADHAKPGDTVVVSFMMAGWSFDRYFDRTDTRRRNYDQFTAKHVATAGEGIDRVWIVLNPLPQPEAIIMKDSPLRIVGRWNFHEILVLELERSP